MDKHEKTQLIRLLDVFGVGPLMIYAGYKAKEDLPRPLRFALIATGVATIGYNGMNYLENEEEGRAAKSEELDAKLDALVGDVEE